MKSLLVAAGLFVGASAWAGDITSLYERGTTNAWAETDVAEGKWSAGTVGTNGLEVTNGVSSSIAIAPSYDTSILTWTATWNPGNATGTANSTNAYISFGDVTFAFYGSSWRTDVTIGTTTTAISGAGTTRDRDYIISVTINQSTNEVSYSFTDNGTTVNGTGTTAKAGAFTTLTHGLGGKAPNWTNTATLKNVEITEEEYTASVANYTVRYLCGETEIKESVIRSGEVGSSVSLQESDKASFLSADGNTKYIYESDNTSEVTVNSDGSTIVNVYFTSAAKFTYTVKAVDSSDNELATLVSKSDFAGNTIDVFWSKYVKVGDQWYVSKENSFYVSATESGTKSVVYEESDIAYFIECENMNGVRTDRWVLETSASNSGWRKIRQNSYYRTLKTDAIAEGGIFDLAIPYNNSNSTNSDATIQLISGETTTAIDTWTTESGTHTYILKSIVIPAGAQLGIYYSGDGNSNARMDYLTLTPSKVSATIGATGYTTFTSTEVLDLANLPAGLTAYYASAVGTEDVTFTSLDVAVPAGTGLLLKGTADESYSIPVAASASALEGNKLVGCTAETVLEKNENYWVLVNNGGTAEFRSLKTNGATIPAGKAYLNAAAAASRLAIVFYDETTGIATVENASVLNENYYNLNGQRIAAPQKGLFIVNGKKVVLK